MYYNTIFVGMDVHKESFSFCTYTNEDEKTLHYQRTEADYKSVLKYLDTEIGKIGIVVCFDRHYPESIRTEALMGAELILVPTANTTAEPSDMFLWEIKV